MQNCWRICHAQSARVVSALTTPPLTSCYFSITPSHIVCPWIMEHSMFATSSVTGIFQGPLLMKFSDLYRVTGLVDSCQKHCCNFPTLLLLIPVPPSFSKILLSRSGKLFAAKSTIYEYIYIYVYLYLSSIYICIWYAQ